MTVSESKKLLVVFGATGQQGGSVVRAILGDENAASKYSLRAVTRDINKPSAKALVEKGVECVQVSASPPNFLLQAQLEHIKWVGYELDKK